jgi:hypothetical protein
MSKFERLLEVGSTELPDCRCAAEMNLMAVVPKTGGDTEIRIFRCPECSHELRLTAWRNDAISAPNPPPPHALPQALSDS